MAPGPGVEDNPQAMFRNILVAVDGSPHGERALAEAVELAQRNHGRLTVMTSVPDPSVWLLTGGAYGGGIDQQALLDEVEQEYQQLLDRAVDSVPADVSVTKHLVHGRPGDRILEQLEAGGHDLVAVGR